MGKDLPTHQFVRQKEGFDDTEVNSSSMCIVLIRLMKLDLRRQLIQGPHGITQDRATFTQIARDLGCNFDVLMSVEVWSPQDVASAGWGAESALLA